MPWDPPRTPSSFNFAASGSSSGLPPVFSRLATPRKDASARRRSVAPSVEPKPAPEPPSEARLERLARPRHAHDDDDDDWEEEQGPKLTGAKQRQLVERLSSPPRRGDGVRSKSSASVIDEEGEKSLVERLYRVPEQRDRAPPVSPPRRVVSPDDDKQLRDRLCDPKWWAKREQKLLEGKYRGLQADGYADAPDRAYAAFFNKPAGRRDFKYV